MKEKIKKLLIRHPRIYSFVRIVYDSTWYAYKISIKRKALHKGFDEAFITMESIFSAHGIEYWPMLGTLLGLHRERGPIAHDLDLDIGVWIEDRDKIRDYLLNYGCSPLHTFKSASFGDAIEDSFEINGVKVDFFYCKKIDNTIAFYDFPDLDEGGNELPQGMVSVRKMTLPLDGFELLSYKGIEIRVPSNIHEHLSCRYGDDYMTPDPTYDYRRNVDCVQFLGKDGVIYKNV